MTFNNEIYVQRKITKETRLLFLSDRVRKNT